MKKKVVIFGCGFHGRAVFRKCNRLKNYEVVAWIDNDKNKINKLLFDKKIYLPNQLGKIKFNSIIISGKEIDLKIKQIKKIVTNPKFLIWGNKEIRPSKKKILKRDKSLKIILRQLLPILEKEKINYWMDSSALLTICRKDNLSIRSDFDISIEKKYLTKIKKLFKSNKFFYFHQLKIYKSKIKIFFTSKNDILSYEPAIVDICFQDFSKKNYIFNYLNPKKKSLKKFFKKFKYIKYQNLNFKIPFESEKYLKSLYGNWRLRKNYYSNNLARKKPYLHQPFIK